MCPIRYYLRWKTIRCRGWGRQPSKNMHIRIASVGVLCHRSWDANLFCRDLMSLHPNFCDKVNIWICIVGKLLSIGGHFCQDSVLHTIFSQLKSALVFYSVSTIVVLDLPQFFYYNTNYDFDVCNL
jgi:hypothetical protein